MKEKAEVLSAEGWQMWHLSTGRGGRRIQGSAGLSACPSWSWVLGKALELIILRAITLHVQDNQGTRPCQHGLVKGYLTNLISFCDSDPLSG